MPDVVVIGGGVIGLTAAYELAGQGVSVQVLEQGQFGREASWAGAGLLPPGNLAKANTPESKLRALGHKLWPQLTAELSDATGIDNGYVNCAGIELRVNEPKGQLSLIADTWRAEGVEVELLDENTIYDYEPNLNPETTEAFRLPEKCQVRNPRHLKSLISACVKRGVELTNGTTVFDLVGKGGKFSHVETTHGKIAAGKFLVCAGAWAGQLTKRFGFHMPVQPVRGQMVLMNTESLPVRHLLGYGKRYLVPRPDGRILVGSTEEWTGFVKQNTVDGIASLLSFARELVPCLSSAAIETTWSGLRPQGIDDVPYVGSMPETENLFVAAGHFRSGLQMSPATGLLIRQIMLEQETTIPCEPYCVSRAAERDFDKQ